MIKFGSSRKMKELADLVGMPKSAIASFDLPCGFTCPMAKDCKSTADRQTGKITDGVDCKFRCYGASIEALFPATRALHWGNYDALLEAHSVDAMADLISNAMPNKTKIVRIHSFGDFFNKRYFTAWLKVADRFPQISFFGYTKVLPYLHADRPVNMALVYSYGGKFDEQITCEPASLVVNSIADADRLGLPVSCQIHPADDYNFVLAQKSFALVLHGTQPAGHGGVIV